MENYRIISLNVRSGLNEKKKLTKFIQYMKEYSWDIALLQETAKINPRTWGKLETELEGKIFQSKDTLGKNAQGIAQIYKNKLINDIKRVDYHSENRISKINIEINNKIYSIINVYLNSNQKKRKKDLIDLKQILTGIRNDIVIGGDFNSILDKKERFARVEVKTIEIGLQEIIKNFNLTDVKTYTENNTPTYIGQNNAAILDRFIVNGKDSIAEYMVEICPISDHQMIILDLFKTKTKNKKPKRLWKLNTSLLKKEKNRESLRIFWDEWKEMKINFKSYKEWWDKGKNKIKQILIEIGKKEAKQRKDEEKAIKDEIKREISKENFHSGTIYRLKKELQKIIDYKIEGAKIRSRELLWPEHEKGSKDFYAIEKKNIKYAALDTILRGEVEIIEKKEIKEEIHRYYQDLYTSEGIDDQKAEKFVKTMEKFKIPQDTKKIINKFIGIDEAKKILQAMKNNRSPGSDGLPKEFYLEMWDMIGADLVETLNNNILNDSLTDSQKEAIIKLLHKKGDRRLLKNWRPVSLLNVDYKIMTAIVAKRLTPVLQNNISKEQGCAIKGRYIYENLKLIKDIIEKHEEGIDKWEGGKIKTIDQEKAFDRIEHKYIFKILEKIDLGPTLTKLIKLAYNDINTRIMTIDGLTKKIAVTRSVRQGCPLSMALYIVASEPLLRNINNSKDIRGIAINNDRNIKITAYADDTTIFIKNNIEEKYYQQIFDDYEKASGARINKEKTKELMIGKYRRKNKVTIQDSIEVLGIHFNHNKNENQKTNWNKIIEAIKKKLNKWKSRKMTILGRITTTNSFGISQLLYLNRIYPAENEELKRIEKIINNYVYDARPTNYSNANMLRGYDEGGFNFPDVRSKCEAQNIQWFLHYMVSPGTSNWTIIFKEQNQEIISHITNEAEQTHNRKKYTLNNTQRQIRNKLENIRTDNKGKTWGEITFKDIYNSIKREKGKKFKIEETLRNVNWGEIWNLWKSRATSNKYKINEHIVISDKHNTKKYYNKSKNCPGCDYAFVQSRDHTFFNCLGAKELQKYVKENYRIEVTHEKIFYGRSSKEEYTAIVSYINTIIKTNARYVGRWGRAGYMEKSQYFEKIYNKSERSWEI